MFLLVPVFSSDVTSQERHSSSKRLYYHRVDLEVPCYVSQSTKFAIGGSGKIK